MPRFNDEAVVLYRANKDLMESVKKFADANAKHNVDDEHAKIKRMTKYAVFNEQLTIAQLGWAKAYARRNGFHVQHLSTQSADSSINSAVQI